MPAQPQEIDPQKAALLAAIAQQGSQGQVAFQAEAARRQQAQQAAVSAIADQSKMSGSAGNAPKAFTQGLQAQSNALGSVYDQDAMMSQRSFNNSIAQTAASNAAYMDQAKAAVPIVNAQTAGTVAQIRAEQEAAAAERAFQEKQRADDAEQARLDAIEAGKDRAAAEEQRQYDREQRDGTADEEVQAEKQDKVVLNARAYDPIFGNIFNSIVSDFNPNGGYKEAVIIADRAIQQEKMLAEREKAGSSASFDEGKKRKLLRDLYSYYNVDTGKTAPKDTQAFGELMRSEGLDPKRIPGYMPESGKAKPKANAPSTKAPERRLAPKNLTSKRDPGSADRAAVKALRDLGMPVDATNRGYVRAYIQRTGRVPKSPAEALIAIKAERDAEASFYGGN